MRNSILFVNPAYHYSFTLRDAFRRMGWTADIYMNKFYPPMLLYADDVLAEGNLATARFLWLKWFRRAWFLLNLAWRYRFFLVYGDAEVFTVARNPATPLLRLLVWGNRSPELFLLKLLGKKILFFPNGCHQEVLKRDFGKHENGNVCANCVMSEAVCNDRENQRVFDLVNRYHDFVIANTPMASRSLPQKRQIKHLALDLERHSPDMQIPEQQRLPSTGKLRILHSFVDEGRQLGEKNIKGSPFVVAAVRKLAAEGHPVEYFYLNNVPSREMRFYQVQADIVVDQLIYGWWGSTAIECMGLGKPVVCYLSPALKRAFLDEFPEYDELPIVEASTTTIYEVLKRLVENPELRAQKGRESRQFAERHFDVNKNAPAFARLLQGL